MTTPLPRIAIVLISYHSEAFIADVLSSLRTITYSKDRFELIIVDNLHPKHGSSTRHLADQTSAWKDNPLSPKVIILSQTSNLGFAGGANVGIKYALEHDFDYVFLHNQDGFLVDGALERLIACLENDRTIGAAQCLLLLHPDTELINSAGNAFHYLGLGYCQSFRLPKQQLRIEPVTEVGYASGAALMLRTDLLRQYGALDEMCFLYHEDLSYGLRLRLFGYRSVVVRDAIFYHKYQFARYQQKFYFIERNRLGVMFMTFRARTLLLLLPMALVLELGILFSSLINGWWQEKLRAYGYWLSKNHWQPWLRQRRFLQTTRTHSDHAVLKTAISEIHFQERRINSSLLRHIGNPLMRWYWQLVFPLIRW